MPSVSAFNVTPVKGLALHHPSEIALAACGVPANRLFFLAEPNGQRISSPHHPYLVQIRCDYDPRGERLRLLFPDRIVEGNARRGEERIVSDFWGRDVDAHFVPGEWDEALSAFTGEKVRLARCDHEGDGIDVRALTLMSLASVEELSRRARLTDLVDPRRFRMTIELDGCEPHEEDTWTRKRIRVGADAVIRVGEQVPRCVITTRDPDTGEGDFRTLKVIHDYRGRMADGGLPFGVYGEVETPGAVRLGDPVEMLG